MAAFGAKLIKRVINQPAQKADILSLSQGGCGTWPGIFDSEPDLGLNPGEPNYITRHGAHRPEHNSSERFWLDFGVFRRRSETSNL